MVTVSSVLLILLIIFLIPTFLSVCNQIFQPTSVKRSWDSVNVLLALVAILCGVFAVGNDGDSPSDDAGRRRNVSEAVLNVSAFDGSGNKAVSDADWLDFRDRVRGGDEYGGGGLRRSSSYPDLRLSFGESGGDDKFKSFDDSEVYFHRPPESFTRPARRSQEEEEKALESGRNLIRETRVDKFVIIDSIPPLAKLPEAKAPPPPPPPAVRSRGSVLQSVNEAEPEKKRSVLHSPPSATLPPPPPPELRLWDRRNEETERKRSGATAELATAIVSLYQGSTKKRKKRSINRDIHERAAKNSARLPSAPAQPSPPAPPPPPPKVSRNIFRKIGKSKRNESVAQYYSTPAEQPPPAPPPPPPPPKVLHNIFKKTSKSKRVHSIPTAAPPPPPPPLPSSVFSSIFKTGSKSKRLQLPAAALPPPPPPPPPSSMFSSLFKNATKSRRFKNTERSPPPPPPPPKIQSVDRPSKYTGKPPKPTKIAPPSPLIPMPPPPPPLPFSIPALKFIPKGDFVRIRSASSSRCSSPGLEDFDVKSEGGGGDSIGPSTTCPSPDVNMKADSFISRLRGEWRLENIH